MTKPASQRTTARLRRDALVQTLADLAPVALVATDPNGVVVYANVSAEDLFGRPEGGMVGRSVVEFIAESRRGEVIEEIALLTAGAPAMVAGNGNGTPRAARLLPGLLPCGTVTMIEAVIERLDHEGAAHCAFTVRRPEPAADPSNPDGATKPGDQLRQFAFLASHDLGSPLAKIAGLVRWLREELADSALSGTGVETLDRLTRQVERMEMLMAGLLDYARAGGTRDPVVEVSLSDLFADVARLCDVPDGFQVSWPRDLPTIVCQRTPLQHILINLVNNAIEHHDRAEGTVTISCRPFAPSHIEFAVEDDGPGIPVDQRERVFNIFHTVGQSRRQKPSSGIGLSIVKRLVLRAGGQVRILDPEGSTPGSRGTRMEFTWRCHRVPSGDVRSNGPGS